MRNEKTAKVVIQVLLVILILYLFLTKLLLFFAPFLLAFLIAHIVEKPARFLQNRCRFPRGAASALSIVIFVALFGGLVGFIFYRLFVEVWELTKVGTGYQNIISLIRDWIDLGGAWYAALPPEVVATVESSLKAYFQEQAMPLQWESTPFECHDQVLTSLPLALLYTVITLVAAYFFSRDREKISALYSASCGRLSSKFRTIKNDLLAALTGYIKAL